MKKFLALILVAVMLVSAVALTSCDDETPQQESSSSSSSSQSTSSSSSSQPSAAELLAAAKAEKTAAFDAYAAGKDKNLLTDEAKSTFGATVTEQKATINAVADIAQLDAALDAAKAALDTYCSTNLITVKVAEFKAEVDTYAAGKTVLAKYQEQFATFVSGKKAELDALTAITAMNSKLADIKSAIDAKVQEYIELEESATRAAVREELEGWYSTTFLTQNPTAGMLRSDIDAMAKLLDDEINKLPEEGIQDGQKEGVKEAIRSFYDTNKDTKTTAVDAAKAAFDQHLADKYTLAQVNRIKNDGEGSAPSTYDALAAQLDALKSVETTTQTDIDNKLATVKSEAYMAIWPWTPII